MHFFEYLFFSAFRGLLLILTPGAARRLGRGIGRLGCALLTRRRHIALDNLRHAFPEKTAGELGSIARGAFENFGISMSEFLRFSRLKADDLRSMMNYDRNAEAFVRIGAAGGMVFMTGHFGNWELTGAGSSCLAGVPYLVIVKTQSNRFVDRVVNRLRARFGSSVVPMEKSVRETMATLGRGGVVALAGDQSAPRESDFVPFFGRTVATFRGPAAFALRARVPLMIAFTVRRPDFSYDFYLEEIRTSDLQAATEADILELTRRHVAVLEKYVRRYPDQWLWMHRRWKHLAPPDTEDGSRHVPAD